MENGLEEVLQFLAVLVGGDSCAGDALRGSASVSGVASEQFGFRR